MLQILGLLLLLLGVSINAELKTHTDTLLRPGSVTLLGLTTIFSPDDAPAVTAPGEGRSEVTVDLAFTPTLLDSAPGQELSPKVTSLHLQLIVLEGGDIRELGDGQGIVCCSAEFPECNGRSDSVYVPTALLQRRFVKVQEVDVMLRDGNNEVKVNGVPATAAMPVGDSGRVGEDTTASSGKDRSIGTSPRLSLWDKVFRATTSTISSLFSLPTSSPAPAATITAITAETTHPVTRLQVTLGPLLATGRYALAVAHCDKAALNVLPVSPVTPEPVKPTSSSAADAAGTPIASASELSSLPAASTASTFASTSTATVAAADSGTDAAMDPATPADAASSTDTAASPAPATSPAPVTSPAPAAGIPADSVATSTSSNSDTASATETATGTSTAPSADIGVDTATSANTGAGADVAYSTNTGAAAGADMAADASSNTGTSNSATAPPSGGGTSTAPAAGIDAPAASSTGEGSGVPVDGGALPTAPAAGGDTDLPVDGEGAVPSPSTGAEAAPPVTDGAAVKPPAGDGAGPSPVAGEGAAVAPGAGDGTTTTPVAGDGTVKPIAGDGGARAPVSGDAALLPGMGVSVRGSSAWLNPYGYLPAALYGYMPLYGLLLLGYLLLALLWLVPLAARRELKLLKIHYVFALVLVAALFDSMLCYWDIYAYNRYGLPQQWISVSCSAARVGHHSLARMLLVALALGYSVYRPALGPVKHYLFSLAAAYALALGLREYLTKRVGDASVLPTSGAAELVLGLPPAALLALANIACAFLESLYVTWIYLALRSTVELLEAGNQQLTLRMYQKYIAILSAGVVAAGAYVFYRYVLRRSAWSDVSGPWSPWWMLDIGFWECLYLVMLGSVAVLWRPSKISPRANYRELPLPASESFQGFEDEEEEALDDMDAGEVEKGGKPSRNWRGGMGVGVGVGAAVGAAAMGSAATASAAGDSVELLEMGGHDEGLGDDLDTDDMVPVSSDEELSEF